MKVVAVNGSPRKNWNTAKMLQSAMEAFREEGAEIKYYDLYSMDFKGCSSCFGCLRLGGPSHGRCAMRDDLTEVLDETLSADALFVGAPVYFGDVPACLRAYFERLWFAGLAYDKGHTVLYDRRIPVKLIYTMNCPIPGFHKALNESTVGAMGSFIGPTELLEVLDTLQFDDYSKYDAAMFDVPAKHKRHEEEFPNDQKRAYEMAKRAIEEIKNTKV